MKNGCVGVKESYCVHTSRTANQSSQNTKLSSKDKCGSVEVSPNVQRIFLTRLEVSMKVGQVKPIQASTKTKTQVERKTKKGKKKCKITPPPFNKHILSPHRPLCYSRLLSSPHVPPPTPPAIPTPLLSSPLLSSPLLPSSEPSTLNPEFQTLYPKC